MQTRTTRPATTANEPEAAPTGGPRTPTGSSEQERSTGRGRATRPLRWLAGLLALAALVAAAAQVGAVGDDRSADATAVTESSGPTVGTEEFLARLAEQGYIPPEAVDRDRLLLERLVERGVIPAETLD